MDDLMVILKVCAIIVFVIAAALAGISAVHISTNPGSGNQIGYISEVSNNGFVWKPTQISLINSEPTYGSQTDWAYGSRSKEIEETAMKYLDSHQKVIVHYEGYFSVWGWEYPTTEVITSIEPAGEENHV